MPTITSSEGQSREATLGGAAAGAGYLLWGLSVIFYRQLANVVPFEILAHRTLWSILLVGGLILGLRRGAHLAELLRDRRKLATLALTAMILGSNWWLFIWAVNSGRILETSLGYFINPLVSVLIGVFVLGERLSRPQIAATGLAIAGVAWFTFALGFLPWISLVLALSFAVYGYLRKITRVDALAGLLVEVLVMAPFAVCYLAYTSAHEGTSFVKEGWLTDALLIATGPMTTLPLLLFTYGAQRIRLTTLGLLQYLVPTTSFAIAVWVYGEPLGHGQIVTFGFIWLGLAVFTVDMWRKERELRRAALQVR